VVPAGRAELHLQPALAFIRTVLVRLERAPRDLEVVVLEIDVDAEGASGTPLAELAVANAGA
jgi:hypothetical protein